MGLTLCTKGTTKREVLDVNIITESLSDRKTSKECYYFRFDSDVWGLRPRRNSCLERS